MPWNLGVHGASLPDLESVGLIEICFAEAGMRLVELDAMGFRESEVAKGRIEHHLCLASPYHEQEQRTNPPR